MKQVASVFNNVPAKNPIDCTSTLIDAMKKLCDEHYEEVDLWLFIVRRCLVTLDQTLEYAGLGVDPQIDAEVTHYLSADESSKLEEFVNTLIPLGFRPSSDIAIAEYENGPGYTIAINAIHRVCFDDLIEIQTMLMMAGNLADVNYDGWQLSCVPRHHSLLLSLIVGQIPFVKQDSSNDRLPDDGTSTMDSPSDKSQIASFALFNERKRAELIKYMTTFGCKVICTFNSLSHPCNELGHCHFVTFLIQKHVLVDGKKLTKDMLRSLAENMNGSYVELIA